jgi:hypothetical protein
MAEVQNCISDTPSLTPSAMQRNWKTPNAFPVCPSHACESPLNAYLEQLQRNAVFAHNKYGESEVEVASLSKCGTRLSVVTRISNGVKGWGLAKITFENGKFIHEACGAFFTLAGASKRHCDILGEIWLGGDSIDDYC